MFVNVIVYVEGVFECGFVVDDFVLCFLFFFNVYNDFFEEVVKFCVV